MRAISIVLMNADHTTLVQAPTKMGFRVIETPNIVRGVETELGTFTNISMNGDVLEAYSRFRAERETANNPLRVGDVLSFEVTDKPIGIGQYNTPVYEALKFKNQNTFDIEISVDQFPKFISGDDFISDRYTIKGKLFNGPEKDKEVEISVSKLAFLNCFTGTDGRLGQESLSGYLHNRNVVTTLTRGEPIRITGCILNDDGIYTSHGVIDPIPFDASAEVQASNFYAGSPKARFNLTRLELTVRFTSGPFENQTANVSIIGSKTEHIDNGSNIDIAGLKLCRSGFFASSFEKRPANG